MPDDYLDFVAYVGAGIHSQPVSRGAKMPDVDVSESTVAQIRAKALMAHDNLSTMIVGGLNFSSEALRAGMVKTQNEIGVSEAAGESVLLHSPPIGRDKASG